MRSLKVAVFLAFKSIVKGHKYTIALMVFILSLSFVNLVFIASILGGMVDAINRQIVNNYTSHIVIDPQDEPTRKDFIPHAQELQREIEQIPGIIATARHYKLAGTMAYDKEKNGKFKFVAGEIIGIEPEHEKRVTNISQHMVDGQYLKGLGGDDILLGANLAGGYGGSEEFNSLGGAKVGEKVIVTFNNGVARVYRVKGVFKSRFGFADRLAFVTVKEAEAVLSVYNNASQILVKVNTARSTEDDYMSQIQTIARNLKVRKWSEVSGAFGDISKSMNVITFVVSAIGLAVAAITIFILIYINAMNKRRQIGILKAIGIKQDTIVYSYILQAIFYTFSGIVIGLLLIFYMIAPYFVIHPLRLPMGDIGLTLHGSRIIYSILSLFAVSLAAGFIPSWQVARQNILKAIWGA